VLLCHLSEAVAAPLSLPRCSEAKAGRGDSPKHGDSERIREQAPRRDYSAIRYFNRLLASNMRLANANRRVAHCGVSASFEADENKHSFGKHQTN